MIKKQQEQNRKIEQKKIEAEIEGKLKQERIAAERAETVRELKKQELTREKLRFEKQQRVKRLRDNLGHRTTILPPTPAQAHSDRRTSNREKRDSSIGHDYSHGGAYPEREPFHEREDAPLHGREEKPKIDSGALAEARNNYVSGGDKTE